MHGDQGSIHAAVKCTRQSSNGPLKYSVRKKKKEKKKKKKKKKEEEVEEKEEKDHFCVSEGRMEDGQHKIISPLKDCERHQVKCILC